VRGVDAAAADEAARRLDALVARGLPNRFGAQRFGRAGDNPALGRAVLSGEAAPRDRRAARFAVSALQALVFNRVLDTRPLPLDRLEAGDVAILHRSGGWFVVEDAQAENERAARFEISASGPIFGTRAPEPRGAVADREARILAEMGIPDPDRWRLPRGLRMRGARRPLRVRPEDAALRAVDDRVELAFRLPSGSFATVLVEALFGPVDEGPEPSRVEGAGTGSRDDTITGPAVS
jgi:tRNA pseudouridine13 synthase